MCNIYIFEMSQILQLTFPFFIYLKVNMHKYNTSQVKKRNRYLGRGALWGLPFHFLSHYLGCPTLPPPFVPLLPAPIWHLRFIGSRGCPGCPSSPFQTLNGTIFQTISQKKFKNPPRSACLGQSCIKISKSSNFFWIFRNLPKITNVHPGDTWSLRC